MRRPINTVLFREKGWLLAASRCRLEHDDLAEWHTRYRMGWWEGSFSVTASCCSSSGFHLHIIRSSGTNPFMTVIHHNPSIMTPMSTVMFPESISGSKQIARHITNYSIDNFYRTTLHFSEMYIFCSDQEFEIFLDNRPDMAANLCYLKMVQTVSNYHAACKGGWKLMSHFDTFFRRFHSRNSASFFSHLLMLFCLGGWVRREILGEAQTTYPSE